MTDEELAAIEARHKAATPGEWFPDDTYWGVFAKLKNTAEGICTLLDGEYNFNSNCENDAKFIIHAHNTDIPALLAEVRRLQEKPDFVTTGKVEVISWNNPVLSFVDDKERVINFIESFLKYEWEDKRIKISIEVLENEQ